MPSLHGTGISLGEDPSEVTRTHALTVPVKEATSCGELVVFFWGFLDVFFPKKKNRCNLVTSWWFQHI